MTKDILILEPDQDYANRLAQTLEQAHSAAVTIVSNSKEACLFLMKNPQELAFIPMVKGDKLVRALRAVQSDVRLVVMVPTTDSAVPGAYADKIQGVLRKPELDADLVTVLADLFERPSPNEDSGQVEDVHDEPLPDTALIISIMQQAELGQLITAAVFAERDNLLVHWGEINGAQAAQVVSHTGGNWRESAYSVRIQFVDIPDQTGDALLYAQRVGEEHMLTLVALPETPLHRLRSESDRLVIGLHDIVTGKGVLDAALPAPESDESTPQISFAIVWRPLQMLPASLHIPLRRALARLADTNNCTLTQIDVKPELVHVVVTCPPGRDSSWAAYLFKNGSEATILQEFSLEAELWDTGYFATESTEPLSELELNLFLEHQVRSSGQ
jgi:hypothetical protein